MARPPDAAPPRRRALIALTLLAVVLGGLLAWSAFFLGLGWPGLILGLAAASLILGALAHRFDSVSPVASYGLAFVLLTWPLLWLPVGCVRYLITGEAIGS